MGGRGVGGSDLDVLAAIILVAAITDMEEGAQLCPDTVVVTSLAIQGR